MNRTELSGYPIVVGYDGSVAARAALRWAAAEASRRGAALRLVYAVEPGSHSSPLQPGSRIASVPEERCLAESALAKAVLDVTEDGKPPIEVNAMVVDGPPVTVLCGHSAGSGMLVLGSSTVSGLSGLFVGSVAMAVAAHAHSPVVVVRDGGTPPDDRRPIVVGVDDSAEAHLAVGFAFEEAALRGAGLVAVRCWSHSQPRRGDQGVPGAPVTVSPDGYARAEEDALDDALRGWRDKYPAVAAGTRLVVGDARHALTDASQDAQLVVVGSRGGGGFPSLLLGSVGLYLLHHAPCPVAVVRDVARAAACGATGEPARVAASP